MKIINVVGARPNFIKIAPLMKEYKKHPEIEAKLIHTGQHYDKNMSGDFFSELEIPEPDYNLNIGSLSHAEQTARIMIEFEKVCLKEKPDLVVVLGDVNSTIACALVAAKLGIKIAHIEAGMRSFDRTMPEEVNRVVTDHVSDFNFCPTEAALQNLKKENIKNGIVVGDIMYDSYLHFSKLSDSKSKILEKLDIKPKKYIMLTMHRQGNTDNKKKLESAVNALCAINEKIIFSIHPRTRKMLAEFGLFDKLNKKITIVDAVGYLDSIQLLKNSKLLLTDSGGMQKEAYFARTPCVTLRDTTEWTETLEEGNVLLGNDFSKLPELVEKQLSTDFKFGDGLYGDGKTAKKIAGVFRDEFYTN